MVWTINNHQNQVPILNYKWNALLQLTESQKTITNNVSRTTDKGITTKDINVVHLIWERSVAPVAAIHINPFK